MADKAKLKARAGIFSLIVVVAIIVAILWYFFGTQAGSRSIKTLQSSVTGMERTVTIYDVNGEVIKEYKGKFDVQYDESRILFDDENGKRHVIYYTTGTVIIDEN